MRRVCKTVPLKRVIIRNLSLARQTRLGAPPLIVMRLNAEIVDALKMPDVIERFNQIGFIPVGNAPEEHAAQIKRDMEVFAKERKAARIEAGQGLSRPSPTILILVSQLHLH